MNIVDSINEHGDLSDSYDSVNYKRAIRYYPC
jgi:hypothetical protein